MFGRTTIYNDVITFDFDKSKSIMEASIDQEDISVRYQDGRAGTIYGKARLNLPNDERTKQKRVPEIQMSAEGSGNGNSANDLLSLFLAKTAKDISLDMRVSGNVNSIDLIVPDLEALFWLFPE